MTGIIYTIVDNAMDHYLTETFGRAPEEKHEQILQMYQKHMRLITDYCVEHLYNPEKLTIEAILGLHKILYPEGHKTYIDIKPHGKLLYLVPGTFKTINNKGFDQERGEEFEFIEPGKVKFEMDKLLNSFESDLSDTIKSKKDVICAFVIDFSHIHPFADGNGKVAVILLDILLTKYGYNPVYINKIKEKDMDGLYRAARHYDLYKKLDKFYEVIEKYSE